MAKEIAFTTTPVYRAKCVPGGVLHHCRKCAKETEHHYVHSGLVRRATHYGKMLVSLITFGYSFPHEVPAPSCAARCTGCGNVTAVPYRCL